MESTFHNSRVIIRFVLSRVIFLIELSWWCKHYSNKAMVLLCNNSMVVITNWLVLVMKYPFFKWQWIFSVDIFFPLSPARLLPDLTTRVALWVSYKKQELLTLPEHLISPRVFGDDRAAHLFSLLCFVCRCSVSCSQYCPCFWIVLSVVSNVCVEGNLVFILHSTIS